MISHGIVDWLILVSPLQFGILNSEEMSRSPLCVGRFHLQRVLGEST
ncbi:hypothetical protein [Brevibacillus porteri]|nr:hypothetical protein [Brevibacillus porteri]MED2132735.1 hypothetical protein [Brevibacillus porteri]MED2894060.1 hypothetical protein [Brevibacillus porteri]